MNLILLQDAYAICRLEPTASIPTWAKGNFISITYTPKELSIVCRQDSIPQHIRHEANWRILEVEGPMDLSLVGVMARLTQPLAKAGVNVFVISTFDTDYILVKDEKLESAVTALQQEGHSLTRG